MKTKPMELSELKELLTESNNGEGVKLECFDDYYVGYLNRITVLAVGNNGDMCAIDRDGYASILNECYLRHYASHKEPKLTELFEYVDSHFNLAGFSREDGSYPDTINKRWIRDHSTCSQKIIGRSIWIDEDFNIVEKSEDK